MQWARDSPDHWAHLILGDRNGIVEIAGPERFHLDVLIRRVSGPAPPPPPTPRRTRATGITVKPSRSTGSPNTASTRA